MIGYSIYLIELVSIAEVLISYLLNVLDSFLSNDIMYQNIPKLLHILLYYINC